MGEMLIWFELPYSFAYYCLYYINDSGSNSRSLEVNHLDPFGLTPSNVIGVLKWSYPGIGWGWVRRISEEYWASSGGRER